MDNTPSSPKLMPLHLLEEITDGFSKHRKLGGGAYGNVYLGEFKNGEKIAVKVLKDVLDLDDEQFEKEYHNLASLHHKNVVQLVGSCNETKGQYVLYNGRIVFAESIRRMLCFEYMCNRSLDKFIYDESNARNWRTRYAIIKGICEGLEYLHEKIRPPMYHLDLKPANILLDENMSPKIADFGLSRLMLEERTKKTNSSVGTTGYMPPEYIDGGLISIKFDIFSLGVVLIKIMTGRDGYFRSAEMSSQQFVELVHTDWMNRLQATSVHAHSIQARKCIEIALSCVETDRHRRPSIGAIVNNLNKMESTQILDALRNGSESSIKKKIVIMVSMPCDKCRAKAMKLAAKAAGVISVGITGGDYADRLEVVGDGVNVVCLVSCLRKKVGLAVILHVEEVKAKKPEQEKKKTEEKKAHPLPECYPGCYHCPSMPHMVIYDKPDTCCSIM